MQSMGTRENAAGIPEGPPQEYESSLWEGGRKAAQSTGQLQGPHGLSAEAADAMNLKDEL